MTKLKEMTKKFDEAKDTMAIYFGDDGCAVAGHVTKEQHVLAVLTMVSSLIERCGGDPSCVNGIIKTVRNADKEEEPEIKIGKLDLNDKEGIEQFIELLKKASK